MKMNFLPLQLCSFAALREILTAETEKICAENTENEENPLRRCVKQKHDGI